MSTITNIPYSAKSMNGIITISDGEAIMENGDIDANNITTTNITSDTHTIDGNLTVNGNTFLGNTSTDIHTVDGMMTFTDQVPECGLIPSNASSLTNKNYVDTNFVYKTGSISETITGIKTFSVPPENSSTITSDNQLTNKLYVDTKFNSIDLSNYVTLNSTQSISGQKTFTGNLISNRNISTNAFMGTNAGQYRQSTSLRNTSIGEQTFRGNATTVTNNTGVDNVNIGNESLQLCEQGSYNVAIGAESLKNFKTSTVVVDGIANLGRNVAIGYRALNASTNQNRCVAIGYRAMASMNSTTSGNQNVVVGHNSYSSATTGGGNTIIGSDILPSSTGSSTATIVGFGAFGSATTSQEGTGFGTTAGSTNEAQYNTFLGWNAGQYHKTGVANIYIGQRSGNNTTLNNAWGGCVVIGGMNCVTNAHGRFILGGRCQHPSGPTNETDGLYPKVCIPNKILLQCCETLPEQASITMRRAYTYDNSAEYAEHILISSSTITNITLPETYSWIGVGTANNNVNGKPASIGMSFYFIKAYEGPLTAVTINAPTGQTILVEGQTTAQNSFLFDSNMRVCSITCINFFTGNPYGNGIYWVVRSRDYNDYANKTYVDTSVSNVTKSSIGLGNVDNTSDANKPISTATQSALDLKAPINNPTFTGTVSGITKSMVGLGNVDNTSDLNKPISTATQAALDSKASLNNPTFTNGITLNGFKINNNSIILTDTLNVLNSSASLTLNAPTINTLVIN